MKQHKPEAASKKRKTSRVLKLGRNLNSTPGKDRGVHASSPRHEHRSLEISALRSLLERGGVNAVVL
jgi:hypothetical protein